MWKMLWVLFSCFFVAVVVILFMDPHIPLCYELQYFSAGKKKKSKGDVNGPTARSCNDWKCFSVCLPLTSSV